MKANGERTVRIGGASGFWGDSSLGPRQLVEVAGMQYISFDYLAELTMSILASAKAKKPELGYATDFVEVVREILPACVQRGITLVCNAGGVNPSACGAAVRHIAAELGLNVRIAVIDGDDIMSHIPALRERGTSDFYTGRPMPERFGSANAYLGALPITRALAQGANVVITGRVVDSAMVLGVLIHEFGWAMDDWDRLAAGSLAGHIIECGCQATGGLYTDWNQIPNWDSIGYPVIDCAADGSFTVSKPMGSGGAVLKQAVAEQMLYEIGDPSAYLLPDVICDFSEVMIEQLGTDMVRVSGARGLPAPNEYKVSATYAEGFACVATLIIVGFDAVAKARRSGEALISRMKALLAVKGLGDFSASRIEVIGEESPYGASARQHDLRESVVRIAVRHPSKQALELFAREVSAAGTSWSPGTTGSMSAGRPAVSPSIRLFSFTIPKTWVMPRLKMDEATPLDVPVPAGIPLFETLQSTHTNWPAPFFVEQTPAGPDDAEVPLIRIALGRSGDKGDTSNIGLIARTPQLLPILLREVTTKRVHTWLAHAVSGTVTLHPVPGINGINLVMTRALDGGGMTSLRYDPLGKSMAQVLLAMPVRVPRHLLSTL